MIKTEMIRIIGYPGLEVGEETDDKGALGKLGG